MATPNDMRCETCLYHDLSDNTCHLRAPMLMASVSQTARPGAPTRLPAPKAPPVDPGYGNDSMEFRGVWPGVMRHDWCGEHKHNI